MKKLTQAQTVVIKKHNIDSNNNNEMISNNGHLVSNLIKLLKEVGAQELKSILIGFSGICTPYKKGEIISFKFRDKRDSDIELFIRPNNTGAFFSSEW